MDSEWEESDRLLFEQLQNGPALFLIVAGSATREDTTRYCESLRLEGFDPVCIPEGSEKFQRFLDERAKTLDPIFLAAVDCLMQMSPATFGEKR